MNEKNRASPDILDGIKGRETFIKIEPLDKGLSGNRKYRIQTDTGKRLLLRVSDISGHARIKTIFGLMRQVAASGVPMPQPVDFGVCGGGKSVYQLLTWREGENLDAVLPALPRAKQAAIGLEAGIILRAIHSVSAPDAPEDWAAGYILDADEKYGWYKKSGLEIEGSDAMRRYFVDNKHLLCRRPICLCHGDFHNGNLLIAKTHALSVIDWDQIDYADPWEEFYCILSSPIIPPYTTGLLRGYFGGEPPEEFWPLLALYVSVSAFKLVSYAVYIHKENDTPDYWLDYCMRTANAVSCWFDHMRNPIPAWYGSDKE